MSKQTTKSFRCEQWLAAAIHKTAHSLDITDSDWITRTLLARLLELDALDFDAKTDDPQSLRNAR
ncbi:hypothetical protein [Streptomyces phaeochromogenes]